MSVLSHPMPTYSEPRVHRPTRRWALVVAAALVVAFGVVATVVAIRYAHDDSRRNYLDGAGWPAHGQAAYALGTGTVQASPDQQPAPIASVAKVMTAYLVLGAAPLAGDDEGFRLTVTAADVADTAARRERDESLVRVVTGERLTERQALAALLLPSANNVAIMLARRVAGTVAAFVQRMNRTAARLGMSHTRYTDPSGFDEGTVSTAADQVILARVAMRNTVFADLVGTRSYRLPVAGTVHNTDRLLGTDGFVGIKTGSDDAAGGCFMFRARRVVGGRATDITGVVLGQHGHILVAAGQYAARQLADRVAPAS